MHIVLLPGLDGTGEAFAPLTEVGFEGLSYTVVSYPPDRVQTYEQNETRVREILAGIDGPYVVVAESYSGPIGARLAADPPPDLAGVVLVATFVTSPVPTWLDKVAVPAFFRRAPPRPVVRHFLAGWRSPRRIADLVIGARNVVTPEVYRHRVFDIFVVDAREALRAARVPLLYLKPTRDRLVRTKKRSLLALQPAMEWVEIDAPHMVLQARPAESSRTICDFARTLAPA